MSTVCFGLVVGQHTPGCRHLFEIDVYIQADMGAGYSRQTNLPATEHGRNTGVVQKLGSAAHRGLSRAYLMESSTDL